MHIIFRNQNSFNSLYIHFKNLDGKIYVLQTLIKARCTLIILYLFDITPRPKLYRKNHVIEIGAKISQVTLLFGTYCIIYMFQTSSFHEFCL